MVERSNNEPIELSESECNAMAWHAEEERADGAFVADLFSSRVFDWLELQTPSPRADSALGAS